MAKIIGLEIKKPVQEEVKKTESKEQVTKTAVKPQVKSAIKK